MKIPYYIVLCLLFALFVACGDETSGGDASHASVNGATEEGGSLCAQIDPSNLTTLSILPDQEEKVMLPKGVAKEDVIFYKKVDLNRDGKNDMVAKLTDCVESNSCRHLIFLFCPEQKAYVCIFDDELRFSRWIVYPFETEKTTIDSVDWGVIMLMNDIEGQPGKFDRPGKLYFNGNQYEFKKK